MALRIPSYAHFIPNTLLQHLLDDSEAVAGVDNLRIAQGLQAEFPHVETASALQFICQLYEKMYPHLNQILQQREIDRTFIDQYHVKCKVKNQSQHYLDPQYDTVIDAKDKQGRIVVGRLPQTQTENKQVRIPQWLQGSQVTLFGPPDSEKMCINAMNAWHRKLPDEPAIVHRLVEESGQVPKWGADHEDSKTPLMRSFLKSCQNLTACFDGSLQFTDPRSNKQYQIKDHHQSFAIKRIPGLALPDGNHLWKDEPLPLHLYDFAMHLYHNWHSPQALVFYVPKLENEEEALYIHALIHEAELMIQALHPEYQLGTIGLFIVFENPRAIFRIREMADALYPYFIGGSLGWHDFLASTARLFKHDPNYQIPVKADPYIVINHIKESHQILRDSLSPIGAIAIGGMYGTLYEDGNRESFILSMVGYIKDVITQMKRGLDGFWVAHPSFVRVGIALVEAWHRKQQDPNHQDLTQLVEALVDDPIECQSLLTFIEGEDVQGLAVDHPLYQRGVLAADITTSDVIANHDEEEVRYNIFQALQYLTDWLCGNGCVALPALLKNSKGDHVFVRVMDDLATTERSRWELWAEVSHGRVSIDMFERILQEEIDFIQAGQDTPYKKVQVRWQAEAARWYPIAIHILRTLVLSKDPVEWVPQLLLPFTFDCVRQHEDPWEFVQSFS